MYQKRGPPSDDTPPNRAERYIKAAFNSEELDMAVSETWLSLGPLLKVKLLLGPTGKVPLNSKELRE